jgi:DNA replication licensing factor MCM6
MGGDDLQSEDITPQAIKERMSPSEWNTIYKMSQDKLLYTNLITSLFPTIHGNEEVFLFYILKILIIFDLNLLFIL